MLPSELKAMMEKEIPAGCFLFCGEEEYLMRYYRSLLRKTILTEPSFATFNHAVFDGKDVTPDDLLEAVKALPMLADKKLIEWNHADLDSLKMSDAEKLINVCTVARESVSSVLLICCTPEGFDAGTDKRPGSGMKTYSKYMEIVRFDKSTDGQLLSWVARHFAHEKLKADNAVCRLLIDRCGHSMDDLSNEIDKIACYVLANGCNAVTAEDVVFASCANIESDTFALTNALLDGKRKEAFASLEDLRFRRVDPSIVMGQLARFYGDLYAVSALLNEGKSPSDASAILKMNAYKTSLYAKAANRMKSTRIAACLALCRRTDLYLKSVYADPWTSLEKLLIQLS